MIPKIRATAKTTKKAPDVIDAPGQPVLAGTGKLLPPCPDYLGAHGQLIYAKTVQTLQDLKLEDAADFRVVEALASAYEDFREARKTVDKDGQTYQTFTQAGELKIVKRPEVDIMSDAWKRMTSLLPQLCLTPASRMKGKAPVKPTEADPFAKFMTS